MTDEHSDSQRSMLMPATMVVAHVLMLVGLLGFLIVQVPEHERMFREFEMKLPALTVVVLRVSNLLREYWYVAPLPVLMVAALDLAVLHALRGWAAYAWSVFVFLLIGAAFFLSWQAVTLPHEKLRDALTV